MKKESEMKDTEVPLRCRCGTDKTQIPCVGNCALLCQRITKEKKEIK